MARNGFTPFAPQLPTVPSDFRVSQAQARVLSDNLGFLDVLYLGPSDLQLHVFESNYANPKAISAAVEASDQLMVGGTPWRYLLLAFPQPDGSKLRIHFAERGFDGKTYLSVGLDSDSTYHALPIPSTWIRQGEPVLRTVEHGGVLLTIGFATEDPNPLAKLAANCQSEGWIAVGGAPDGSTVLLTKGGLTLGAAVLPGGIVRVDLGRLR